MPQAFKIYRIVCTITDKALVSGSSHPNARPAYAYGRGEEVWYERGTWSRSDGAFWKTEASVRKHLHNLCHDWETVSAPARYPHYEGQRDWWQRVIPGTHVDWSRLQHLSVETIHVTEYNTVKVGASDFMGIPAANAA